MGAGECGLRVGNESEWCIDNKVQNPVVFTYMSEYHIYLDKRFRVETVDYKLSKTDIIDRKYNLYNII